MRLMDEYAPLVIVGVWNRAVFTPEWVSKYLFNGESVRFEYPNNIQGASLKFITGDMDLFIIGPKLFFTARATTSEIFQKISETALQLARVLPHTPVVSFGINHKFECPILDIQGSGIFNFSDKEELKEHGYIFKSLLSQRTLQFEHHDLNLIWTLTGNSATLEFNNDYQISDLISFNQLFTDGIIQERKNQAVDFIKKIYRLDVE